jgi:hypothetical protein
MTGNQKLLITVAAALAIGCGGSSTGPDGTGGPNTNAKVLTATINGSPFTATTLVGAYLGGSLTINGFNSVRSLNISAINLNGPGTYSLGLGNPNSALAQVADGTTGQFSTGYGGTGTLTLTIATLGHIKGQFTFTAYTSAGGGLGKPVVTVLDGVFDITTP